MAEGSGQLEVEGTREDNGGRDKMTEEARKKVGLWLSYCQEGRR